MDCRENLMSEYLSADDVNAAVESLDEAMRVLWPCRTAEMRALLGLLVHSRMRLLQMLPGQDCLKVG